MRLFVVGVKFLHVDRATLDSYMGNLRGFVLLLLVSWIITKPAAGQNLSSCGNCTVTEVDNFLNDKELKVSLLARHALFLQLVAESTDCGKYSLYCF